MSVDPEDHEAVFQRIMAECEEHGREFGALKERVAFLDGRRRESRQLLRRFVKYVREDRAVTPGKTRLERLTAQVDDYLKRTTEPGDALR